MGNFFITSEKLTLFDARIFFADFFQPIFFTFTPLDSKGARKKEHPYTVLPHVLVS